MRTITFYTHIENDLSRSYKHTKYRINETGADIHTTQLNFISFDLLEKFDKIYLNVEGLIYELKLGQNTWTDKELRMADHKTKEVCYQYSLFDFLYKAIPNYMELRDLRSYNRELRKLKR